MRTVVQVGVQIDFLREMLTRAVNYYKTLYNCEERQPPVPNLNVLFTDAISLEMSAWMRRYPEMEEIKNILHNMPKGKQPKLDGLIVEVLVHHWETIHEDLLATILHFFHNQRMLTSQSYVFGTNSQRVSTTLDDYSVGSCM